MKKQNGFISSSSSVTVSYSVARNVSSWAATGDSRITGSSTSNWSKTQNSSTYSVMTQYYDSYDSTQSITWNTFESNCYEKIEYFLEANERIGDPYSKSGYFYQNLMNYSSSVAIEEIYNGFIDLVITLPCEIRLAGIELLNPWLSDRFDSSYSDYWRYLPCKFNIYKVNTDNYTSETLENVTYDNSIANTINLNKVKKIRPIKYNAINNDPNLILLGTYNNINWKNISSYKCFFKYNENDYYSRNALLNSGAVGTATWNCKQLVIRIFETKKKLTHLNLPDQNSNSINCTYIERLIYEYILKKELDYGTTYAGGNPTLAQISKLYGVTNISSENNPTNDQNWSFGSKFVRSYKRVKDIKFQSGIDYKLGGIQLLISPDLFSISEMKMYNYAGRGINKVYIGEYDPKFNDIIYYGVKNLRTSGYIDIDSNSTTIEWEHNFNISPLYLEADVFIRFKIDYDTFKMGDVIGNLVNSENAPLSLKITDRTVSVSLSKGIGFVNPNTGEFLSFMNGIGAQMDRPGNFDGLKAAIDVGADIVSAGSFIAASIKGDCPYQIYFVVKRLF